MALFWLTVHLLNTLNTYESEILNPLIRVFINLLFIN